MTRLPLALCSTLLLTACIGRYRPDANQHECTRESARALAAERQSKPLPLPVDRGARLQVVRLTDDGELHNRCEWTQALSSLKADSAFPKGTITVMFVHGWKHNAEPRDDNLRNFTQLLDSLRAREARATSDRRVVGLYLAWSGRRSSVGPLNNFTFWGRKRAADRIAQSAIVTKFVGAVDNIRRQRENPNDRVVYAGHSFGARLLYNAVAQLSIHRSQLAHPGSGNEFALFDAAGDLVLLVNPAFEAQLFTALDGLSRQRYRFAAAQRPLLVSISAENDAATGKAFPIGQWLGRTWNAKRRITLGTYKDYQTHTLRPAASVTLAATAPDGARLAPAGFWFDHFCNAAATRVCLEQLDAASMPRSQEKVPGNPFIVAKASKAIVNGHGGIWKPEFVTFLADFIATAMEQPPARAP